MRGVFDDRQLEPVQQSRDTELTLGTGSLLAIFTGLVLVCGFFFWLGYTVGHQKPIPAKAISPQAASEQEPLQATGNIPKPSAVAQTPVEPAPPPDDTVSGNGTAVPSAETPASPVFTQPEVRPAISAPPVAPQSAPANPWQAVHPAMTTPQAQQFMVQVAAVSNPQDAEALANALKKRSYPVISKREPSDNLIHVRVGPFPSKQVANEWSLKLLNDGYNAQVQP